MDNLRNKTKQLCSLILAIHELKSAGFSNGDLKIMMGLTLDLSFQLQLLVEETIPASDAT
ncbi:hypothetical protein [Morganella psychrotolerans]|uniref:Uncharacterized protein n=1 Tax=Morganella psychrotolerans TaxID=368603 RepID=A0A1B8HEA9_9GAMM|nr:hypothetical protein [Morganella psychrotolerans]OBU07415.1 hypothetical protein AYY17_05310 [Morganella psychrotolerans]